MASRSSGRFRESPNPAAVSTRSLSICRGSIAGSASRSCRPRAAFCPTTKPAPPMSAARCCAACSETPGFEVIMSRIGKHPVAIPQGVEVQLSGQTLTVKGRLGALTTTVSGEVAATVENGAVTITPGSETKRARALWGTTRALVNNMVMGVANGFTRNLEINGVGYRAAVQGKNLTLQLGYSHDINYPIPLDVAHLRPDHRRSGRPHAGGGLDVRCDRQAEPEDRLRYGRGERRREAPRRAGLGGRRRPRRLRSRRLSVSRPDQGAGRRRPRGRPAVLERVPDGTHPG